MTNLNSITNGNLTLEVTSNRRQEGRFVVHIRLLADGVEPHETYVTEPEQVAWTDHRFINPHTIAGFLCSFLSERNPDRFTSEPGDAPGWGYEGLEGDLRGLTYEMLVVGRDGIDYQTQWIRENWPDCEEWDIDDLEPEGLIFIDGDLYVDWGDYDAALKGIHR